MAITNRRVFYAVQALAFAQLGSNTFTVAHGVTQVGMNTKFNLEQAFELGQLAIYQNYENLPDVELTAEKNLDGYPLLYHLATKGASSPTLVGRSNIKSIVGLSIYTDTQDSASGTPVAQATMSGMFPSAVSYDLVVNGACKESISLVGNNKTWSNVFTANFFNNTDVPLFASGLQRREHVKFGPSDPTVPTACLLPQDIPGISASGTNILQTDGSFAAHIQSIKPSVSLGREAMLELGQRGVYFRYINFPVEVKCDIEVLTSSGDGVGALENATTNVVGRKIVLILSDGTKIDLGTQNKLSSVNETGGNAQANGGNVSVTYSYLTFNDFTVTHPQDPSGL